MRSYVFYLFRRTVTEKMILVLGLLLGLALSANAAITGGVVNIYDEDYGQVFVSDGATVNVYGTTISTFYLYDSCILNVSGGFVSGGASANEQAHVNIANAKINNITGSGQSIVNVSGDSIVDIIYVQDDSRFFLSGGNIKEIKSNWFTPYVGKAIEITCDLSSLNYDESAKLLTGNWLDGSEFEIKLNNLFNSNNIYNNIEFVPEPGTFLLLATGAFFFRKTRQ